MALSNQQRVGTALELLQGGLAPFVEREIHNGLEAGLLTTDNLRRFIEDPLLVKTPISQWDTSNLLKVMWETWREIFQQTLGFAERSLVSELREWRNRWAHQKAFSSDDTDRALDSAARLLIAISAPQAEEVERLKKELRRQVYEEQVRGEKRKAGGSLIEPGASTNLKSWREVVMPHPDVASGRYQQAEFAADLWQVHLGEGTEEYRQPQEFFRRTFLTGSLRQLLSNAIERLSDRSGDPVVQLQTNFGGGKTHSMLALYHLFSGLPAGELTGIEDILSQTEDGNLPAVRRVVLVGNKISPGNPVYKADGTIVRTLWGELAYQLGGRPAYEAIQADDERATNPGDRLRQLFNDYGPCLILIDEWVAYARQLHDRNDLPAGNFETQFSFAQALTESAKLAHNCLLVISLPASDSGGNEPSNSGYSDDVEVGGVRGREALERLRNVVGRIESSWRPATAEEGFEIVRRRLFEPLVDPNHYKMRDLTAKAFADLYRAQRTEFPPECSAGNQYERRIQAAYPIHPEIFDQLYGGWSSLVKFQRTRGVLRLMASVVHSLWESGDLTPLILPATIPIDDSRVKSELTRYLSDNWDPIIEKDVDGPNALPTKIDGEKSTLGKFRAARRVARTVYLGSAPTTSAAHRGLEDRRVKLGCVMPGESPSIFGDALRHLAATATYLYQDGIRFWYSTQPTVTRLAEERAEELKRNSDRVADELDRRLAIALKERGLFTAVYPQPRDGGDVPDEMTTRLVVLSTEYPYRKGPNNPAEAAAKAILEMRGNTPRLYRNTLAFLVADSTRLQELEEGIRQFLAWQSILADKEVLNLDHFQMRQAEAQLKSAETAVMGRLPETYRWLLFPVQRTPKSAVEWEWCPLTVSQPLVLRASNRLRQEDGVVESLGVTILVQHLSEIPLWRGQNHVAIRRLLEDYASYIYLSRLLRPEVLLKTIATGLALLTWRSDSFAYAESYDEAAGRYRGLRAGQAITLTVDDGGVLVRPEVASRQLQAELAKEPGEMAPAGSSWPAETEASETKGGNVPAQAPIRRPLRRFYATAQLDPTRTGRDASQIANEVIAHLVGQLDSQVTVTLEITAWLPNGANDQLVRTVTENSNTLKFSQHGFEPD